MWRYVPLKKRVATAGLRDEDLVTFIYAQAHEAITSLRDVESHKVQDDDVFAFYDFVKACGRWFGRNEHVASLLRDRFPDEVARFLAHGQEITVPIPAPPHNAATDIAVAVAHLRGHVEIKAERLRGLGKVVQAARAKTKP